MYLIPANRLLVVSQERRYIAAPLEIFLSYDHLTTIILAKPALVIGKKADLSYAKRTARKTAPLHKGFIESKTNVVFGLTTSSVAQLSFCNPMLQ